MNKNDLNSGRCYRSSQNRFTIKKEKKRDKKTV